MYAMSPFFAAVRRFALPLGALVLLAFPALSQSPAPKSDPKAEADTENYTSVIIDAREMGVGRGEAPKICRPDGSEVWGTKEADPDDVQDAGIVVYANTMEDGKKNKRCGAHPLILRAIKADKKISDFAACISDDDAKTLLAVEKRCRFMDANKVIFIVDK